MDAGDGPRTVVVIVADDVEVAVGRTDGRLDPLALVDALARLQLAARRLGWSIRLPEPCPMLGALLDLTGLADVVGGRPDRRPTDRT